METLFMETTDKQRDLRGTFRDKVNPGSKAHAKREPVHAWPVSFIIGVRPAMFDFEFVNMYIKLFN